MRDRFPGYVLPSESALQDYWANGTFAVDANVLLNLYRYSFAARAELLAAFEALGDRLWIPHRAAEEFHQHRAGVIVLQQDGRKRVEAAVQRFESDFMKALNDLRTSLGRRQGADELAEAARLKLNELKDELLEIEQAHQESFGSGDLLREDPIYDKLVSLFGNSIGPAFPQEELDAIYEEAKERYAAAVPPGYKDQDKPEPARYGDVVVWKQLLAHAATGSQALVFVTDDRKDDWFWRVSGPTIGPRPELVAEMWQSSSTPFHMYTPDQFVRLSAPGVSDEVLSEVRDTASETSGMVPDRPDWDSIFESLRRRRADVRRDVRVAWLNNLPSEGHVADTADVDRDLMTYLLTRAVREREDDASADRADADRTVAASHVVHGRRATLVMNTQGAEDAGVGCAVVSPSGATVSRWFERPIDGDVFIALFPDSFDGAPADPLPGRYQVEWLISRPGKGIPISDSFSLS